MNERIKELAEQCWDKRLDGVHFDIEMFAELIVKECMRMCEVAQAGYLTHGLEKEAAGAFSVKQYIEEYLGVESTEGNIEMTPIEKAIRDFCGRHADWWPSTTQVQEMLALAQPCPTCEALARTVMLDQTSHDTQRQWVGLTDEELIELSESGLHLWELWKAIERKLKEKNT